VLAIVAWVIVHIVCTVKWTRNSWNCPYHWPSVCLSVCLIYCMYVSLT